MCSGCFSYHADSGSSCTVLTWCLGLDFIIMQNTKVLEDHEIRHRFHWSSEDVPPQHVLPRIVKYTGTLAAPEWEDIERGGVFSFPWYFVKPLRVKKTSSKRYAMSRPTSPPLRIHQNLQ